MGYRQAVRHMTLTHVCVGSNPLAQFGKIYLSYQNSISFMLFLLMLPPSGKLIKEPSQGSGGFLVGKPGHVQSSELFTTS